MLGAGRSIPWSAPKRYRIDSSHKIRDHVRVGDLLPMKRGAAAPVFSAADRLEGALEAALHRAEASGG